MIIYASKIMVVHYAVQYLLYFSFIYSSYCCYQSQIFIQTSLCLISSKLTTMLSLAAGSSSHRSNGGDAGWWNTQIGHHHHHHHHLLMHT